MPAVNLVVTAEEADAIRALVNVERAQKAIEEQTKKNAKASENWGQVSDKALEASKQKSNALETGLKGVEGILGAALTGMKLFGEMGEKSLDRMREKADNFRQSIEGIDKALSSNGEISLMPQVDEALSGIRSRDMNQKEIRELFSHAMEQGGGEFSAEQVIDVVKESVMARAGGKDAKVFASTMLALKDAGFEDDETGSVSDKTTELMDTFKTGLGDGEKKFLGQMKSSGMDHNTALRLLRESKQSDQGAKVLQGIMNVANMDINDSQLKAAKKATPEQEAELQDIKARQLEIDKRRLAIDEEIAAKPYKKRMLEKEKTQLGLEDTSLGLRARDIDAAAPMTMTADQERLKRLSAIPKGGARIAEIMKNPELLGDEKASFSAVMSELDTESFSNGGAFGRNIAEHKKVENENLKYRLLADQKAARIDDENRKTNPTTKDLLAVTADEARRRQNNEILDGRYGPTKQMLMRISNVLGGEKINSGLEASNDQGKSATTLMGDKEGASAAGDIARSLKSIDRKTKNRPNVVRPPGGTETDSVKGY